MPRLRKLAGRNARRRRGGAQAQNYFASGGGSGELYTSTYKKGASISVTIGAGGYKAAISIDSIIEAAGAGGTTKFGDLSISGGGGGRAGESNVGGASSGSIATSGSTVVSPNYSTNAKGGYGNKNNPAQTYGNGGDISFRVPEDGKDGAVILTYLGR